ncbi:MAG: hypothetical protein AAGA45_04810, partial [Verrucomicrobiota bacterium]
MSRDVYKIGRAVKAIKYGFLQATIIAVLFFALAPLFTIDRGGGVVLKDKKEGIVLVKVVRLFQVPPTNRSVFDKPDLGNVYSVDVYFGK